MLARSLVFLALPLAPSSLSPSLDVREAEQWRENCDGQIAELVAVQTQLPVGDTHDSARARANARQPIECQQGGVRACHKRRGCVTPAACVYVRVCNTPRGAERPRREQRYL